MIAHQVPPGNAWDEPTDPKYLPSCLIVLTAATWLLRTVAALQSSSGSETVPVSIVVLFALWMQASVEVPVNTRFRHRRIKSKSVPQNAPLPTLSTTVLFSSWLEFLGDVVPLFAVHQEPAHRSRRAKFCLSVLAAPPHRRRQIRKVSPAALARVNDEESSLRRQLKHVVNGGIQLAHFRNIVPHR